MSNELTGSPFKIDTAGTIFTGRLTVNEMVWKGPDRRGESILVEDSAGRTLWEKTSLEGGPEIEYKQRFGQQCNGIVVAAIDSGTLYIYFKNLVIY